MVVGAAWDMDSPMRKAHGARKHIPTSAATSCLYREPKSERSDDEVRQALGVRKPFQ